MHVSLELAAAGLECKQCLALLQQGLTSYFCEMGRNVWLAQNRVLKKNVDLRQKPNIQNLKEKK